MTYRERQRLADIQAAIDAIRSHLQRGDLSDGLIFDAVRIRLPEIGEAVKALPAELLDTQPAIPWRQITRMRDHLAHAISTPPMRSCRRLSTTTCPNSNVPSARWSKHCLRKTSPARTLPAKAYQGRRAAKPRTASESAASGLTLGSTLMLDMRGDREAPRPRTLRLDHPHDQALCGPKGAGDRRPPT